MAAGLVSWGASSSLETDQGPSAANAAHQGEPITCHNRSIVTPCGFACHHVASDLHQRYTEIVQRAHKAGLAGATVLRGIEGFGASQVIHKPHHFRLSQDMSVLIMIANEEDRIR